MAKKTKVGTKVKFLNDVYDYDGDERKMVAKAGQTGVVIKESPGMADWPDVQLDDGRVLIADMEDTNEIVVVE